METSSEEDEQAASKIILTLIVPVLFFACRKPVPEIKPVPLVSIQKKIVDTTEKKATAPPKKKKKKIYLTFDDGPNKGTSKVMHIAEEEQVPITMFIIGEHVYASKTQHDLFDSLENCNLIEICNHSFTHAWQNHYAKFYNDPDSVVKDFVRCKDSLHLQNNIVRTPGRNIWRTEDISSTDLKKSTAAGDSLENAGFTAIGWDLEWQYESSTLVLKTSADSVLNEIDSAYARNRTKNPGHLVLLAHDQVYADADDSAQLHQFIRKLKEKDYELEVVSKYPGVPK